MRFHTPSPGICPDTDRGAHEAATTTSRSHGEAQLPLIVALVHILVLLLAASPAWAACGGDLPEFQGANATQGTLYMHGMETPGILEAPVLHTDVSIAVSGPVARATVRQRFLNPGDEWAEGMYVFPLPETAAVDHMRMWVGDRIIEGQIQEREEAKRTYEQAKQAGKRASLVQQERPNIFTTSVANIAPGAEITVEIEYQETLRYTDGSFQLRFPMTVAPRYTPGHGDQNGESVAIPEERTAEELGPVVTTLSVSRGSAVNLEIDLNAGLPLADVSSPSHPIAALAEPDGRYLIALEDGDVPSDRDFVLVWTPKAGATSEAALFTEERSDGLYLLCMLMPPQPDSTHGAPLRRELVLVVDTSGSMHGASLDQARNAVLYALDHLKPIDTFNIVKFSDEATALFPQSVAANGSNVETARTFARALQTDGGTNMRPAIEAALADQSTTGAVRQVVFLTDGGVSNEDELFGVIKDQLGASRLFTVGIGSAPNSHFMRRAAEFGRGTFTYIGSTAEVEAQMVTLLDKLEAPMLTDIRVDIPGLTDGEFYPARIPDLYQGEPLVVAGRCTYVPQHIRVTGRLDGAPWSRTLGVVSSDPRPGVSVLWARRKIASLMQQKLDGIPEDRVRAEVLAVALRHHLVSRYTSLVAVDVTPVRPANADLKTHAMKGDQPASTNPFAMAKGATWAPAHLYAGVLACALAVLLWRGRRMVA